jgi:choline dehydrogenase-like flavoprotein
MPIVDLRDISTEERLEADICIVGSGPAGSTIARELDGLDLRVIVVESGGTERSSEVDALNEIENIGRPRVMDQWLVRNRILGGSSHTWTGRCAPFDEIDYENRNWVPHSGWPFGAGELVPFLDRAAPYLGLGIGSGFSDHCFWKLFGRRHFSPAISEDLLHTFFWQFSKDDANSFDYMRFGKSLRTATLKSNIILNATVTNINTNPEATIVRSLDLRSMDGALRQVKARCIVLCAGGIENARLLLASRNAMSAGLGNQNDQVGRFLMDHPRGRIGVFDVANSEALQQWFGLYNLRGRRGGHRFRRGFRLSPDYQRKHKLLNAAVWLNEVVTNDDPWNALSRMLRGRGNIARNALSVGSNLGLVARGLKQFIIEKNGIPRKLDRLELECIVEQQPDPTSRITLSDRRDRLGVPISRIDWKIGEPEERTVRTIGRLVQSEFRRLSLNELHLDNWLTRGEGLPLSFPDIAHPTGTTRMSDSPKTGVVDSTCQVHDVQGLFVAGSSIFPTSGHANPTLMIVATAIRLADLFKKRLSAARA